MISSSPAVPTPEWKRLSQIRLSGKYSFPTATLFHSSSHSPAVTLSFNCQVHIVGFLANSFPVQVFFLNFYTFHPLSFCFCSSLSYSVFLCFCLCLFSNAPFILELSFSLYFYVYLNLINAFSVYVDASVSDCLPYSLSLSLSLSLFLSLSLSRLCSQFISIYIFIFISC